MPQNTLANPLVSIITICKNPGEALRNTIQSVLTQTWDNIEYIIIDGASSDQHTQDILKAYTNKVDLIVSEPDRGISHAFNKGIEKSTGDIIGLLNGGDTYSPDAVESALKTFQHSMADFCFGDCMYHEAEDYSFIIRGEADYQQRLHYRMPAFNHPTVFIKRPAYEECGLFSEKWQISMDYELLLRLSAKGKQGIYIPKVMAEMGRNGLSISNMPGSLREVRAISIEYGLARHKALYHYSSNMLRYWAGKVINRLFGTAIMKGYRKRFIKGYTENLS